MNQNQSLSHLLEVSKKLESIEAVAPARAATVLGVSPRTIYRRLKIGVLEQVPFRGRIGVSVRSLLRQLEERYGSTREFNLLEE